MDGAERLAHRLAILDDGRILPRAARARSSPLTSEPQVVEVFGEWVGRPRAGSGAATWAAARRHPRSRCEISGETAFCYTDDAAPARPSGPPARLRTPAPPGQPPDVFLSSPAGGLLPPHRHRRRAGDNDPCPPFDPMPRARLSLRPFAVWRCRQRISRCGGSSRCRPLVAATWQTR